MSKKEFSSLIVSLVVLIVSMFVGYGLLALVYEGSRLIMMIFGLLVVSVSAFLVVYASKLGKYLNKDGEDENKTKE
ncbi:MAG: hypothetical protein WC136_02600 [Sphaerochaeta sp.]